MGKAVQASAKSRGHEIGSVIDQGDAFDIQDADIVFEATIPDACLQNVSRLCEAKKDFVLITTGWYDHMDEVQKMVETAGVRCIWSSNFSIGVHVYCKILENASKLIDKVDEYDIWGTEIHHHHKADSPSGTAKTIEDILLKNIQRKTSVVEEKLDRKILPHELHFSSTRGGPVNFGHTIGFDSEADSITLQHSARNRDGYALGAVKAGEWLLQQKPGLYSMDDYLKNILESS